MKESAREERMEPQAGELRPVARSERIDEERDDQWRGREAEHDRAHGLPGAPPARGGRRQVGPERQVDQGGPQDEEVPRAEGDPGGSAGGGSDIVPSGGSR